MNTKIETCQVPIPVCVEDGCHNPPIICGRGVGHSGPHATVGSSAVAPVGTESKSPSPSTCDRTELTVNEMTQHIHQHSPEPRDLDYRVQAFSFALTSVGPVRAHVTSLIDVAKQIEDYLRNGAPE